MTTLRFRRAIPVAIPDPLRPAWCEPDETAAVGVIELRPHARQHETTGGHRVVLPALLTLALVAGEATVDVEPGHWQVRERIRAGAAQPWTVLVPDAVGIVDDCDLVIIDPATLTPATPPTDAWLAALSAVAEGIPGAVADYLDANPPSAAPDATAATKGLLKLAGDLAGTADAPTVPGLASKATAAALTAETTARTNADAALAADIATRQTAAQVDARVQQVVGAAPAALDTLTEIAARLESESTEGDALVATLTAEITARQNADAALDSRVDALELGGGSGVVVDDAPAAPAEGQAVTYWVTSAATWPAGVVWSDDPDGGTAPTVASRALVTLITQDGVTYAVGGSLFTAVDGQAPSWVATLTTGSPSSTSVVVAASALATDNVAVTVYERSLDSGSTWAAVTPSGLNFTLSGLTPSTAYPAPRLRAKDAAGLASPVLTAQAFTTAAPPADTAAPTPGTLAGSAITASGFTLTVTGASDAGAGLHATPYAFSTDNGATWSGWQASAVYAVTGKAAATGYTCRHKVRDAATTPNEATGTAITVTTGAAGPTVILTDDFTADDGALNGRTTTTGSKVWATVAGTPNIVSNQLRMGTSGTQAALVDVGVADYTMRANITLAAVMSWGVWFIVRSTDLNNRILVAHQRYSGGSGNRFQIIKNVSGTEAVVSTVEGVLTPGTYQFEVTCTGSSITLKVDGVEKITGTVPELASNTKAGFGTWEDASWRADDLVIEA